MKADLRKSGIEIIGEVPWGTHFCQFYQGKEDLLEILVPYFKQGLENNEFCMWVTSEPLGAEDAKKALKEKVKNLDEYIKKGQIEILDFKQWYTKSGTFDADKVLQGWVEKLKQGQRKRFDGLRLTGNAFWLEKKNWEDFIEYEENVNNVIGKYRMLAICTYSLDKRGASEIIDVVSTHQFTLIKKEGKWQLIESSERKKDKEALSESETRYGDLVENTPDIIYSLDTAGNIISANKAVKTILGFEPEEVIGRNINEFISNGVLPKAMATFKQIIRGEKFTAETIVIDKDKKRHHLEILSTPIIEDKKVVGTRGVIRDITERKKAEQKLQAAYEKLEKTKQELIHAAKMAAMGQLAAGISHELNQPLTGIKGFAQAALIDLEKNSPIREDLNKIVEQADRMDKIIKNVRLFSRKSEFKLEEIDIPSLLRNNINQCSKRANIIIQGGNVSKRREKREPIICPNCHGEMVCMNKFESIYNIIRGFYAWYACPRRKGEGGCGHSVLLEISPTAKRPQRIVSSVESKKFGSKKIVKK